MQLKAFTLVELIIVVTLIGIMATFAIPNFSKSADRAYIKDMTVNLQAIYAAQKIYFNTMGVYAAPGNLASVNTTLGLGIIDNGTTYACSGGATFSCTAAHTFSGGVSTYTVTDSNAAPACSGYCP